MKKLIQYNGKAKVVFYMLDELVKMFGNISMAEFVRIHES
jgi:hypothetical protein